MGFVVVIPARHASTRLPGKALLAIAGKPMVQRVYEQAKQSSASRVIIATDHASIADAGKQFAADVCMTRVDHPSGTDRLAEVVQQCGLSDDTIVVNVQGDEPFIPPSVINQVADLLAANPQAEMATLCEPLASYDDLMNPNVVKVVPDASGRALYFSRAPIPWARDAFARQAGVLPASGLYARHIGIYAYRAGFLKRYVGLAVSPLEQLESLEQLRVLWHGGTIMVAKACEAVPGGIDTPADYERACEYASRV
ncbi:MAG: 3-deoxy-manno-octulosonate cytidylyltransferase [Gammaproteobacteria bacterium]|nr:MAG: 3-deoxy-manno-octulosonate cytidylyltransferase [Gammaproteobacteria bacterium]